MVSCLASFSNEYVESIYTIPPKLLKQCSLISLYSSQEWLTSISRFLHNPDDYHNTKDRKYSISQGKTHHLDDSEFYLPYVHKDAAQEHANKSNAHAN